MHGKGLSHAAIHGFEADTVAVRRRYDLGATTRRVAAHFGRRALSGAFGIAGVVAGVTGGVTGAFGLVALAVASIAASIAVYSAPDWAFDAPDPVFERGSIVADGMTDKEVMRRFAIVTERDAFEAERVEEERKRAERKSKARQNF